MTTSSCRTHAGIADRLHADLVMNSYIDIAILHEVLSSEWQACPPLPHSAPPTALRTSCRFVLMVLLLQVREKHKGFGRIEDRDSTRVCRSGVGKFVTRLASSCISA